ncbi:MAG TPA: hypothetical protein VHE35_14240 [Kofleriaceae bacterium]|nr:hypothetical protein [Kofleriaceae bacterium]
MHGQVLSRAVESQVEDRARPSVTVALTPMGPMVDVYDHVVPGTPPIACTSYVTRGFRDLGHDEIVFTLRTDHRPERVFVLHPVDLLRLLHWRIQGGERLQPGALVGPPLTRAIDWPPITGFAFERALPIAGLDLPRRTLAMLALFGPEHDVAHAFGPARVLSRLAVAAGRFPAPAWCDLDRAPVAAAGEVSRLGRTHALRLPAVTVTCEAGGLHLRVARSVRPALARSLDGLPAPFALLATLDRRADARLVWVPGQERPRRFAPPGSRGAAVGGAFVAFVEGHREDAIGLAEDGFVVALTDAAASSLRTAIRIGASLELPAAAGRSFRLAWTADPD